MTTRKIYAGKEMDKVNAYLEALGEPRPNPVLSIAFTEEDEHGNIVAIAMLQSLPVAEPMKAEPGYGHLLKGLFEAVQEFVYQSGAQRVLSHTAHPAIKKMLERVGAQPVTDQYYDWQKPQVKTGATAEMLEVSDVRRQ